MTELTHRAFVPVSELESALEGDELEGLAEQLPDAWEVEEDHHLVGEYDFDDFKQAMDFASRVAALAEELDHHPDICFGWGYAEITIWTHKLNGLTLNDFIFAARADALL